MRNSAVLLIHCPDRKGLVAAISNFLLQQEANILHADQHQDAALGLFFMRVEWDLSNWKMKLDDFPKAFSPIAEKFDMQWRLQSRIRPTKVALFVSKYGHCLADILYRHHSGELGCEIPVIVSNHPDMEK